MSENLFDKLSTELIWKIAYYLAESDIQSFWNFSLTTKSLQKKVLSAKPRVISMHTSFLDKLSSIQTSNTTKLTIFVDNGIAPNELFLSLPEFPRLDLLCIEAAHGDSKWLFEGEAPRPDPFQRTPPCVGKLNVPSLKRLVVKHYYGSDLGWASECVSLEALELENVGLSIVIVPVPVTRLSIQSSPHINMVVGDLERVCSLVIDDAPMLSSVNQLTAETKEFMAVRTPLLQHLGFLKDCKELRVLIVDYVDRFSLMKLKNCTALEIFRVGTLSEDVHNLDPIRNWVSLREFTVELWPAHVHDVQALQQLRHLNIVQIP